MSRLRRGQSILPLPYFSAAAHTSPRRPPVSSHRRCDIAATRDDLGLPRRSFCSFPSADRTDEARLSMIAKAATAHCMGAFVLAALAMTRPAFAQPPENNPFEPTSKLWHTEDFT